MVTRRCGGTRRVAVHDTSGFGLQFELPLRHLSILFGKNGVGKSLALELLASLLDSQGRWAGRHPRENDDAYVYGFLYVAGDWRGRDWEWLSRVLAADMTGPEADVRGLRASGSWYLDLDDFIEQKIQEVTRREDERSAIRELANALLPAMVVSYQPHADAQIDAYVHASVLDDQLRSHLLDFANEYPDSVASQGLAEVALHTRGFVRLLALRNLDEEAFPQLKLVPPCTLRFDAGGVDAERVVQAVVDLMLASFDENAWLVSRDDGRYDVHSTVVMTTTAIERLARDYVPAFVLEHGNPHLRIPAPELWDRQGRVVLGLERADRSFVDVRQLSSGLARWLGIGVVLAASDVAATQPIRAHLDWSAGIPNRVRYWEAWPIDGRVVLIDEPELHLHPVAQRQIAEWLQESFDEHSRLLVATHSTAILNVRTVDTQVVGVTRDVGRTEVRELTDDLLDAVDSAAGHFGVDRASWLQLVRGVLFVEGEHDLQVLRRFFEPEISRARVAVIPIRGHRNIVDGTVILDFFGQFGIPIRVLLDDVDAAVLRGDSPTRPTSSETKLAEQLTRSMLDHPHIQVLEYDKPDIWCALPVGAVQRAFRSIPAFSWGALVADWRTLERKTGFKSYVLKRLGLDQRLDSDGFLECVLSATLDDDVVEAALSGVVRQALTEMQ